jgi:hypothetical protein
MSPISTRPPGRSTTAELSQRPLWMRPVMGAVARRHQVEAGVGKGERLDIAHLEGDVGQTAFQRQPPPLRQHRRRKIDGDHMRGARRQRQRRVPGAAAGVQHLFLPGKRSGGHQGATRSSPPACTALVR